MIDFVPGARARINRRLPAGEFRDHGECLRVRVTRAADDIQDAGRIAERQSRCERHHIVDEQELAELPAVAPQCDWRVRERLAEKSGGAVIVGRFLRSVHEGGTENASQCATDIELLIPYSPDDVRSLLLQFRKCLKDKTIAFLADDMEEPQEQAVDKSLVAEVRELKDVARALLRDDAEKPITVTIPTPPAGKIVAEASKQSEN